MEDDQTFLDPAFFVQAMTPWANLSESGYDANIMIHGLIWDMWVRQTFFDAGSGEQPGLPVRATTRDHALLASEWFVDTFDTATGAPVSILTAPRGPFVTTPPVAEPGAAPSDSEIFPTRVLKRKFSQIKSSIITAGLADNSLDAAGTSLYRWSGVLRKRIQVSSRQGLFFGFFGRDEGLIPDSNDTLIVEGHCNGAFYYKLRR